MRILLRADAGEARGTGHVMRCLTLGEALTARGHTVELMGRISGVPWLEQHLIRLGMPVHDVATDSLDPSQVAALRADRIVVDSYWIDPLLISRADRTAPVLAIIDHDSRGIEASWFLDQNLGAEDRVWSPGVEPRLLAGSRYALVRSDMVRQRRDRGWVLPPSPSVVAFMGGTDPHRYMTQVATSLARVAPGLDFTAVTTTDQLPDVAEAVRAMPNGRAIPPTPDLPELLGDADVVVSAAGTSAWDVLTLGRPTVLVGVVDNQSESLALAVERGLALGLDATREDISPVGRQVVELLGDETLRRRLVTAASELFDGAGADRVADRITSSPEA
jgi:spore coat polysaccharide biosynthesis predicted glycosyltransferase SpsG